MDLNLLSGNYIDLIILLVIFIFIVDRVRFGFGPVFGSLITFISSIVVAFFTYSYISGFLTDTFDFMPALSDVISFIISFVLAQTIIGLLIGKIVHFIPGHIWSAWWSKLLAIIPAFLDISIILAAILFLLVALPLSPSIKNDIMGSVLGNQFVSAAARAEGQIGAMFGRNLQNSLTFLTVRPEDTGSIDIPYRPSTLTVDETSEERMFLLINAERTRIGVKALTVDPDLTEVARSHSQDMWENGYFSHTSLDGSTPAERVTAGGVTYFIAGENLAFAPTVQTAHIGLMNSPGHKANILNPLYGRVGIGVIDGGIYGKMFTQNFAN